MSQEVLSLFDGEEERNKSWFNDKYAIGVCASLGFGFVVTLNWATRRPLLSGMYFVIL